MRDVHTMHLMHAMKNKYGSVTQTNAQSYAEICVRKSQHLPCTINHKIQCLYQEPTDKNCFYWTMMIALGRLPPGFSNESKDLYTSEIAKQEIQRMRINVTEWWCNRPDAERYHPARRWMVTLEQYYKRYCKEVAQKIATEMNVKDLVRYIRPRVQDTQTMREEEAIGVRFRQLYDELTRLVTAQGYDEQYEVSFKGQCYFVLDQWSKQLRPYGVGPTCAENDGNNDELSGGSTVVDDEIVLKEIFATVVFSHMQGTFVTLKSFKDHEYRYDEAKFDSIKRMNVGTHDEEAIAVAAIFKKIIIELFMYDACSMWDDDQSDNNDNEWTRIDRTLVKLYGTKKNPCEITYMRWKKARRFADNGAILVATTACHIEPVCSITGPQYLPDRYIRAIRRLGCILRSTSRFGDALALACGLMPAGFQYCCDELTSKTTLVCNQLIRRSVQWWKKQEDQYIASMHARRPLRFVYDINQTLVPKRPQDVELSPNLRLDMRTLYCDTKLGAWETAYALSHVLEKRIFVVRGLDNITGYGGTSVVSKAEWTDVVDALRLGTGVCCFTPATQDDDNFDVTHVIVPLYTFRGGGDATKNQHIPFREEGGARIQKEYRCACAMYALDNESNFLPTLGDHVVPLTLSQADSLLTLSAFWVRS